MAARSFIAQIDGKPVRVKAGGFAFSDVMSATLFEADEVACLARLLSLMYPGDRVSFRVSHRNY